MTVQRVTRFEIVDEATPIDYMSISDGVGGHQRITSASYIPQRFTSVQEMLALPLTMVAHRGGGDEYPECTIRAYTQAVYQGYGILEIPIARTVDGVLFGLHDQSLDRTSGGTFPPASEMTWAEVQEYQVLAPAGSLGGPEPYMMLEELVDAYASSHNLILDPKHIDPDFYPEIFAIMDSTGGPDRWIGKFVGHAQVWWDELTAKGYERFRPFYQHEWTSTPGTDDPPEGHEAVTIVGIDATAAQEYWDDLMSTGKPIWTHGTHSVADVNTAISRGADGVQVSIPRAVDPYV